MPSSRHPLSFSPLFPIPPQTMPPKKKHGAAPQSAPPLASVYCFPCLILIISRRRPARWSPHSQRSAPTTSRRPLHHACASPMHKRRLVIRFYFSCQTILTSNFLLFCYCHSYFRPGQLPYGRPQWPPNINRMLRNYSGGQGAGDTVSLVIFFSVKHC